MSVVLRHNNLTECKGLGGIQISLEVSGACTSTGAKELFKNAVF